MSNAMKAERSAAAAGMLCAVLAVAGCASPGVPQPPSLHLPKPVGDLQAQRVGDAVDLSWTMPATTTDGILMSGGRNVTVCRSAGVGACQPVQRFTEMPKAKVEINDQLPAELVQQAPQLLRYEVQVFNTAGRTAGASNAAYTASGIAPAPVSAVQARIVEHGVELSWQKSGDGSAQMLVQRKLIEPASTKSKPSAATNPLDEREPTVQWMRVSSDAGGTLDTDAVFGTQYSYTVQRVHQVTVDGRTVELRSDPSAMMNVEMRDLFPPKAPHGLMLADPVRGADGNYSVDMAWEANTEADFAGYFIHRSEDGGPATPQNSQPVAAPSFHDTGLQPGHKYTYSISATDKSGNRSARSAEQSISIP